MYAKKTDATANAVASPVTAACIVVAVSNNIDSAFIYMFFNYSNKPPYLTTGRVNVKLKINEIQICVNLAGLEPATFSRQLVDLLIASAC